MRMTSNLMKFSFVAFSWVSLNPARAADVSNFEHRTPIFAPGITENSPSWVCRAQVVSGPGKDSMSFGSDIEEAQDNAQKQCQSLQSECVYNCLKINR